MATTNELRTLLAGGKAKRLVEQLVPLAQSERIRLCRPLAKQAKAVLSASYGSPVRSWLKGVRADYPGGHEQFVDAWNGMLSDGHRDAATAVFLASTAPAPAAEVWPIPDDLQFAEWVFAALFPNDLAVFTEQWSADFAANPKHWERHRRRTVMFAWVEKGLVEAPRHWSGSAGSTGGVCWDGWRSIRSSPTRSSVVSSRPPASQAHPSRRATPRIRASRFARRPSRASSSGASGPEGRPGRRAHGAGERAAAISAEVVQTPCR